MFWSRTLVRRDPRSFQELRTKVSGIIAVRADGDKVSRMAVVSAKFEAGQVFLPERASWLADFEAELFAFPGTPGTTTNVNSGEPCSIRAERQVPADFFARDDRQLGAVRVKEPAYLRRFWARLLWCGLR